MKINLFEHLAKQFLPDDIIWCGVNYTNSDPSKKFEEFKVPFKDLKKFVIQYREKGEVYVCYTPIKEGKPRRKVNALDSYFITMDIDGALVPEGDFAPSFVWETSKGKFQGMWNFDKPLSPEKQEEFLGKMLILFDFDACSKDIVHYYRFPNSYNYKYVQRQKVKILPEYCKNNGSPLRLSKFEKLLKPVKYTPVNSDENVDIELIDVSHKDLITQYGLSDLVYQAIVSDRSTENFKIQLKMFKEGATKEEVKVVLLNLPPALKKFDWRTVDQEINRSYSKYCLEKDKKEQDVKIDVPFRRIKVKGQKVMNKGVKIIPVNEVEPFDDSDFWLIENFWQKSSVGLIGAPSKSFKSTLTINLACSVATGSKFDDYEVQQGGVLIVQAENSLAIEKQKIFQITGKEDLPIYFVDEILTIGSAYKLKDFIIKNKIKLLILDPLYLLFGHGDINKHTDISERLSSLTNLRNDTGCAIMLVHHTRKIERGGKVTASDMYGSAFIEGWYESMILLQRNGVNTSRMTTFFRNHKSGDKYTLLVNDNMTVKVIPDEHENDFDLPQKSLKSLKGGNSNED